MKISFIFFAVLLSLFFTGCFEDDKDNKFYGNVDLRTVSLGFRVGGKIQNLYFDEGQSVEKNATLAKLDSSIIEKNIDNLKAQIEAKKANISKLTTGYRDEDIKMSKANLQSAKANLEKTSVDLKRYEKLLQSDSVAKQEYDNIKLTYQKAKADYDYAKANYAELINGYEKDDIDVAKAELKALEANLAEIKISLDDTTLYAPTSGTILTRNYEVGSIVSEGTPIMELAQTDEYWVRSYIEEKYLGKIKQGMSAKVYTDSNPNHTYTAKVSFISAQAEFTPKNVETQELRTTLVYRFRLILDNPDDMIRQGMPVTIEFDNFKKDED